MSRHIRPSRYGIGGVWKPWIGSALLTIAAGPAFAAPVPASGTISNLTPSLTWAGGGLVGANVDESTCMENTTCEVFTLTLAPGDYTGKRVRVDISWLLVANDYDLYIHA